METRFKVGDYVRVLGSSGNRLGTLVSDPNAEGLFIFRDDLRLTDKVFELFVYESQIERCEPPTDDEARVLNAIRKRGS